MLQKFRVHRLYNADKFDALIHPAHVRHIAEREYFRERNAAQHHAYGAGRREHLKSVPKENHALVKLRARFERLHADTLFREVFKKGNRRSPLEFPAESVCQFFIVSSVTSARKFEIAAA